MVIRRKSSIYKRFYEINGQKTMFGHDNIHFKTINLPKKQKYKNLSNTFGLKKICIIKSIKLPLIEIS